MRPPIHREIPLRSFRFTRWWLRRLPLFVGLWWLTLVVGLAVSGMWAAVPWVVVAGVLGILLARRWFGGLVTEIRLLDLGEAEFRSGRGSFRIRLGSIEALDVRPFRLGGAEVDCGEKTLFVVWGAPGMFDLIHAVRAANPEVKVVGDDWLTTP